MPQTRPSLSLLMFSLLLVESSCAVHLPQPLLRPVIEAAPLPAIGLGCAANKVPLSGRQPSDAGSLTSEPDQRFAAYGDTRTNDSIHREIVDLVLSFHPKWVLQTGDLVEFGKEKSQWETFDKITAAMHPAVPYYPARGNHDVSPPNLYEQRVTEPVLSGNKLYYSFEKGDLHFISIDTEQPVGPQSAQGIWIKDDLAKARAAGCFIIPFFHRAIYSVGHHAADIDIPARRKILHALFQQHDVRLVFEGHDHSYYHTIRDGITYVVTGGGGAPLNGKEHPGLWQAGDVFESAYHFCIVDESAEQLAVTVYRRDRTKIDEFTVKK